MNLAFYTISGSLNQQCFVCKGRKVSWIKGASSSKFNLGSVTNDSVYRSKNTYQLTHCSRRFKRGTKSRYLKLCSVL